MSDLEINGNTPQAVKKIAAQLWRVGWMGFWLQLALAIAASFLLLFNLPQATSATANPATGGSLLLAFGSLLILFATTFWSFRYVVTSRKLKNPDLRPKKAETIKLVQLGLMASVLGMGASVLAAESIAGILLGKSFSALTAQFGIISADSLGKLIQPLDVFIVLANTHIIAAHFIGIVASLWLLDRINKQG
jgi:hypothetical protein